MLISSLPRQEEGSYRTRAATNLRAGPTRDAPRASTPERSLFLNRATKRYERLIHISSVELHQKSHAAPRTAQRFSMRKTESARSAGARAGHGRGSAVASRRNVRGAGCRGEARRRAHLLPG